MTCIIATGARTPVGNTAAASAAAVWAGISRLMEHPYLEDRDGVPVVVGCASHIDEQIEGVDRFLELGLPALREATEPLRDHRGRHTVRAFVGLPGERPGVPGELPRRLKDALAGELQPFCSRDAVTLLSRGHASGLLALERACEAIDQGAVDCCVVGGIDCMTHPATLRWLEQQRRLLCHANSHGFSPGEAAGFVLLASAQTARELDLPVLAEVLQLSTGHEQRSLVSGDVCCGDGLTEVLAAILEQLPAGQPIQHQLCDLNGEPYRINEYSYAALRLGDHLTDPAAYVAPVSAWGDVGVATGPLLMALFCACGRHRFEGDRRGLIWTGSDTGERAAVLLQRREHQSQQDQGASLRWHQR